MAENFYCRYVNDGFCVVSLGECCLIIFSYGNSRHPNIRFTNNKKKELDRVIPFLDVVVDSNC